MHKSSKMQYHLSKALIDFSSSYFTPRAPVCFLTKLACDWMEQISQFFLLLIGWYRAGCSLTALPRTFADTTSCRCCCTFTFWYHKLVNIFWLAMPLHTKMAWSSFDTFIELRYKFELIWSLVTRQIYFSGFLILPGAAAIRQGCLQLSIFQAQFP